MINNLCIPWVVVNIQNNSDCLLFLACKTESNYENRRLSGLLTLQQKRARSQMNQQSYRKTKYKTYITYKYTGST